MFTLVAKNLMKSFGEITPVKDASLTVKEGEVYGILGPSGAGKSTILKMIIGLIEPDSGFVRVIKYNPLKHRDKCMKYIGIVPVINCSHIFAAYRTAPVFVTRFTGVTAEYLADLRVGY